jgi:hypothetical protein
VERKTGLHKGITISCRSNNNPHVRAYCKYYKIQSRVIKEVVRQQYCRLIAKSDKSRLEYNKT